MMKNLYFVSFFYDENKQTSVNIEKKEDRLDIYLSNCCTALLSAKINNPDIDVAIVTNLLHIEKKYLDLLNEAKIEVIICPFDSFVFPDSFKWSAAFYKLCALEFICNKFNNVYDNIMYSDSDVFCQLPFFPIWEECSEDKILLFDLCESSSNSLYNKFCDEISFLNLKYPVHYGGEFYASSTKNAIIFVEECRKFYDILINNNVVFTTGDEIIISSVGNTNPKIKNAGAFVFRFWTDSFRISTTRFLYNPVQILHCPDQKERGLRKLFRYYVHHKRFPKRKRVHSILKLNKDSLKTKIIRFLAIFFDKYKIANYYE